MPIRFDTELGTVYYVGGKKFAHEKEATRYYNHLVRKELEEREDANNRGRKREIKRDQGKLSTNYSDQSAILGVA